MVSQQDAKVRSESLLRGWGVPINVGLPFIESLEELSPPSAGDVAKRGLVLCSVIGLGHGMLGSRLRSDLETYSLWEYASNAEKELLARDTVTQQEKVDCTWLAECVQVLAWGLGLVELDHFRLCDDSLSTKWPIGRAPTNFVAEAKLRPFDEIYLECDLLYRLHWASREAWLKKQESKLNESIIQERDRAIRWLAGVEQDWDQITTDT